MEYVRHVSTTKVSSLRPMLHICSQLVWGKERIISRRDKNGVFESSVQQMIPFILMKMRFAIQSQ